MKDKTTTATPDATTLKRRDVLRLSAALTAFGAAMGLDIGTGRATEHKLQDTMVSSKNANPAKTGTAKSSQTAIKKTDSSQQSFKGDIPSSKK